MSNTDHVKFPIDFPIFIVNFLELTPVSTLYFLILYKLDNMTL